MADLDWPESDGTTDRTANFSCGHKRIPTNTKMKVHRAGQVAYASCRECDRAQKRDRLKRKRVADLRAAGMCDTCIEIFDALYTKSVISA